MERVPSIHMAYPRVHFFNKLSNLTFITTTTITIIFLKNRTSMQERERVTKLPNCPNNDISYQSIPMDFS